jgi:hypothetical protein
MINRPESALAKAILRFALDMDRQDRRAEAEGDAHPDARGRKESIKGGRGSMLRRGAVSRR